MAHVRICPTCSFANTEEASFCERDGTSLVTVEPISTTDPEPWTVAPTTRDEASFDQVASLRDEAGWAQAPTTRNVTVSSSGSLLRLPVTLADRFVVERELPTRGNEGDLLIAKALNGAGRAVIKLYRVGMEPKDGVLQLIAGLDGRYVIRQLEYGVSERRTFEVLEYAEGGSFADLLRKRQCAMTQAELRPMISQIAEALSYLHGLHPQMVHRDIKPDNVLVRSTEPLDLVLADFGIASVVEGGTRVAGSVHRTIRYAAPEAMAGDISPAMDWWSLGMMVVEAAIGRHPFADVTEQAISIHLLNRRPLSLEAVTDSRLRLLCRGLLAHDQKERWGMNEVRRWLDGDSTLRAPAEISAAPRIKDEEELRAARPYRLGQRMCWTAQELALAMCENWEEAVKRIARRTDLERWLTHDLNDQNLLNTFLDISEIPETTPEFVLMTFLQVLLPEAIPLGVDCACLEPGTLKTCLQAAAGVAAAERQLGRLRMSGKGLPANAVEAERLFRRAASKGDEEAAGELKKVECFKKTLALAQGGNVDSQSWLGFMYESGEGVVKDDIEAVKWYRVAAEQGNAVAQLNLGGMYGKGQGLRKDDAESARWLQMAAERGNTVVSWFRAAAEQGNALAEIRLGWIYWKGQGVAKDDNEAARWWRMAAEQGAAGGQYNLGCMYQAGDGVTKDDNEAVRWWRMAAEQGAADGQNNLGRMYQAGDGVAKDDVEAVKWYRMAAEQGCWRSN